MFRVFHDPAFVDRGGEADRDGVVLPAFRGAFDLRDQLFGRKLWAGIEFALFGAGNHQLHVGAADVDDEDLFHRGSLRAMLTGVSLSLGAFCDSASLRAWPRERSRKWSWACKRGAPSSGFK